MPNELKCSFCDDLLNPDDNDSNLCGACADILKSERDRLIAEVAKLNKALDLVSAELTSCPYDVMNIRCDSHGCSRKYKVKKKCWKTYYILKAERGLND